MIDFLPLAGAVLIFVAAIDLLQIDEDFQWKNWALKIVGGVIIIAIGFALKYLGLNF